MEEQASAPALIGVAVVLSAGNRERSLHRVHVASSSAAAGAVAIFFATGPKLIYDVRGWRIMAPVRASAL
jgi:hypothetical protein